MMMRFMTSMKCMYSSGEMHGMYRFNCGWAGMVMRCLTSMNLLMYIHVCDIEPLGDTGASYNMPSVCV